MKTTSRKDLLLPLTSLFTSLSTLICCALPALLVSIGAGATLAGIISNFPQLIFLSKYKILVFSLAGIFIFISGIFKWINRNAPCPIDPKEAKLCMTLRKISNYIYLASILIFFIGIFFAFIATKIN
ncbi:MAG: hypothetical protein CMP15_05100 [Rickettsiales bacterium]|nr:hypothetical protein [Rickettsiales bacterium]